MVSRISNRLYQIDLSGRFYTAELSLQRDRSLSVGDPVFVRVVEKSGNKAMLEIVEPEFTHIDSPGPADISRLAVAAGWPEDAAGLALVEVLVERRLPLKSEMAMTLYQHLKSLPHPDTAAARGFLDRKS